MLGINKLPIQWLLLTFNSTVKIPIVPQVKNTNIPTKPVKTKTKKERNNIIKTFKIE
jgi:hypothetical protein